MTSSTPETNPQRNTVADADTETGPQDETETFESNAEGVAYSSESAPSADAPARPATIAPAAATGRRKEAVARVRIVPGTGKWTVNGRELASYFPNKLHQQVVNEPFATTQLEGRFDVTARIHGGGITGQAGALRLGVARCLNFIDEEANRPDLKKAGLLTRDARVIERKKAGLKKAVRHPSSASADPALRVMTRLFGTDGVRGLANESLTAELALDLSVSAAHVLAERGIFAGHRPLAVVGRDTRISGQFLEAAVVAGLASAGVDVLLLGELPTPGVAWLTSELGADLGVMLSASHNAMPDNGIKFLARGGVKLDDAIEVAIEKRMREPWHRPTGGDVGRVSPHSEAVEQYAAHLVSTIRQPLEGVQGRPRLRPRRRLGGRAACAARGRCRGDRDLRGARRAEHQRRLRVDPPRRAAEGGARARRRRRLRARR